LTNAAAGVGPATSATYLLTAVGAARAACSAAAVAADPTASATAPDLARSMRDTIKTGYGATRVSTLDCAKVVAESSKSALRCISRWGGLAASTTASSR